MRIIPIDEPSAESFEEINCEINRHTVKEYREVELTLRDKLILDDKELSYRKRHSRMESGVNRGPFRGSEPHCLDTFERNKIDLPIPRFSNKPKRPILYNEALKEACKPEYKSSNN